MIDPTFLQWLTMCASNDEFVSNYNRLRGTRLSFAAPARTPFEKLIDEATGHTPHPRNATPEMAGFILFCADMLSRIDLPAAPEACTS